MQTVTINTEIKAAHKITRVYQNRKTRKNKRNRLNRLKADIDVLKSYIRNK